MKQHLCILLVLLLILISFSGCGSRANAPYTYTCNYNNQEIVLTVDPENCTISDGVYTYHYTIPDNRTRVEFTYPNGATYRSTFGDATSVWCSWSEGYDRELYISGMVLKSAVEPLLETTYWPKNLVLIVLCFAVGFINLAYPKLAWYCTNGWMYRNAEPSDAALIAARVSGGILVLMGLFLLFL